MAMTTLLLLMMDGYHGKADVAELQEEIDAMGRGRKGCSAENASLTLGKDPMMVDGGAVQGGNDDVLQVLASGEGRGPGFEERGEPGEDPGD